MVAFTGAYEESDTKITLGNRSATCEIVTRSDRPPRAEFTPKQVDCDITWPLSQLQASDGTEEAAAPRLTIFGSAEHDEHPGLLEVAGFIHRSWFQTQFV